MTILGIIALIGAVITAALFRRGGVYNPILPKEDTPNPENNQTTDMTTQPQTPEAPSAPQTNKMLLWDTRANCYHGTRVLCDNAGLTYDEKNILCACIFQESRFNNNAKCENKDKAGKVWSTDWGICQINDYWHIGPHKDFPSVQYVLDNPDKAVQWMIDYYQRNGNLNAWVSYSSGAYKTWLLPASPMWKLASIV